MVQPFSVSELELETEFSNIAQTVSEARKTEKQSQVQSLETKLNQVRDIQNTIKRVSAPSFLDDIELFEIKSFALLSEEILALVRDLELTFILLPNLQEVVAILDPDGQHIPHFYIYSSYSETLSQLRIEHKKLQIENPEKAEEVRFKALAVEDEIREKLSAQLVTFSPQLQKAIDEIAYLDVLLAKAKQVIDFNLVKPIISHETTSFKGLFNPQIKEWLELQHKIFQPIDIELTSAPCLITGVNMGGKTVLLKTIALSQYLFQFGFFVPAASAQIVLVDKILTSIGDDQSELNGLSSFAAEMMNLDEIISKAKTNTRILALIDELARTTNPEEGKAIVNATLDILSLYNVRCLITTHYSGLKWSGRRLMVKGLRTEKQTEPLTVKNINDYMDYSLIEHGSESTTKQAIQIAQLLGIDDDLLQRASEYLKEE
jgi:DNA mismatch repair ATPase MutS